MRQIRLYRSKRNDRAYKRTGIELIKFVRLAVIFGFSLFSIVVARKNQIRIACLSSKIENSCALTVHISYVELMVEFSISKTIISEKGFSSLPLSLSFFWQKKRRSGNSIKLKISWGCARCAYIVFGCWLAWFIDNGFANLQVECEFSKGLIVDIFDHW